MRFRHIFSETRAGLRQNLTMTLAVIMTMWVSLSLFGAGLLASQQVDLMKGRWYEKIEISVFLCTKDTRGDQCDPGVDATQAQKDEIRRTLESNPEVAPGGIYFETKEEAYADFQQAYEGSPIQDSLTVDQMQESFRVKLKNPEQYQGVVSSVIGLKGVQKVQDLHQLLDPFFRALNVLQWSTGGASVLLLLASALQIGNTIRLATFARRREIGIMRLVGASNFYITVPFLLEAVFSAFIGILLACATLAAGMYFWVINGVAQSVRFVAWIGWRQTGLAMLGIVLVGVVLAVIPTLVTTRRYLRV
jgi:cell division transport system permease protein